MKIISSLFSELYFFVLLYILFLYDIFKIVMNMKEDKDILHYHLIMFYSIYASILNALPRQIAGYVKNPQEKYSTVKREIKAAMDKDAAEHYTYLKEHEGDILKL